MAEEKVWKQDKKELKKPEMTLEEAREYRASLHKASQPALNEAEKREQFRIFWAQNKNKYGAAKELEPIIWVHLKAVKLDSPADFEKGLAHFGLKKIK